MRAEQGWVALEQDHRDHPALEDVGRPQGVGEGDQLVVGEVRMLLDVMLRGASDLRERRADVLEIAFQIPLLARRPLGCSKRAQFRLDLLHGRVHMLGHGARLRNRPVRD